MDITQPDKKNYGSNKYGSHSKPKDLLKPPKEWLGKNPLKKNNKNLPK